jgi:hypothetical protein
MVRMDRPLHLNMDQLNKLRQWKTKLREREEPVRKTLRNNIIVIRWDQAESGEKIMGKQDK